MQCNSLTPETHRRQGTSVRQPSMGAVRLAGGLPSLRLLSMSHQNTAVVRGEGRSTWSRGTSVLEKGLGGGYRVGATG